jgi:hypothetical protein
MNFSGEFAFRCKCNLTFPSSVIKVKLKTFPIHLQSVMELRSGSAALHVSNPALTVPGWRKMCVHKMAADIICPH